MKFIRRVEAHERRKTFMVSVLVFGMTMNIVSYAIILSEQQRLGLLDFLMVAAISFAGAILFGWAAPLLQPSMIIPNLELDDGEEGLGVPARLIPPSPVLGARAFPDPDERKA